MTPKLKEKSSTSRNNSSREISPQYRSTSLQGRDEISLIWEQEVEKLLSRKFQKIDEVIEAIGEGVTQRLGGQTSETQAFIQLLIETDPEFKQELGRLFSLRIE